MGKKNVAHTGHDESGVCSRVVYSHVISIHPSEPKLNYFHRLIICLLGIQVYERTFGVDSTPYIHTKSQFDNHTVTASSALILEEISAVGLPVIVFRMYWQEGEEVADH
jgi:hypothetical protein